MTRRIFLVDERNALVPMQETAYDSEALLQRLIANFPDLLAGEDTPQQGRERRWLLITREMGVPDGTTSGSSRWALDHLFIDNEGVPTLVEVKRSTDTRIRREVVGQMLDYAANAVVHWPLERIRQDFEDRCTTDGLDPFEQVATVIGPDGDEQRFWTAVKTNLQAGRVRMVFVADVIPSELRRIVEFLNEQMDPAEVLAIEIAQFLGTGVRTLVPRILGRTETAQQRKSILRGGRELITEAQFYESFAGEPDGHARGARAIRAALDALGFTSEYVRGKEMLSHIPILHGAGPKFYPLSMRKDGIHFQGPYVVGRAPFTDDTAIGELEARLRELPGVRFKGKGISGRPEIPWASVVDANGIAAFSSFMAWLVERVRSAPVSSP